MRTSKIMTFSVPPAFEGLIYKYAEKEHRTISEFLREAVRRYIAMSEVDSISEYGKAKTAKKGLKPENVDKWVDDIRKSRKQRCK
jgi:hypothetical protein